MADKTIDDLPVATELDDNSLFVVKQQNESRSLEGRYVKEYVEKSAKPSLDEAKGYADTAKNEASKAAESAKDAADVALYPPILKDGSDHWWTWNTEANDYVESEYDAGVSVEFEKEVIVGEPGTGASIENLGTKTDPLYRLKVERGAAGEDGVDGFSPKVDVAKEGKKTTITITDAEGPHVAEVLDGEDGAGQVTSVNGQTGEVNLSAEDVGTYTKAEVDTKVAAATSRSWEIAVPASGWSAAGDPAPTWNGHTAKWVNAVAVEGLPGDAAIKSSGISFVGGDRDAAGKWRWLVPDDGSVLLCSDLDTAPAADFVINVTEVR